MKFARFIAIRILALVCFLTLTTSTFAQTKDNSCDPSPSLKEELKKLPKFNENESTYKQYQERRMASLGALAKKYPSDFHVQKLWADARRYDEKSDRAALVAEYRALMEKQPNDATATYLYASLMVGRNTKIVSRNTKEAIEKLNQLAAKSPWFPWTYLKLGEIYTYPAFRDQAKSRENLKQWAAKCPDALDSVYLLSRSGDQELMRDALRRLRARLASSTEPEDMGRYSNIWSLEFKLKPVPEHAGVRQQIAEEVKKLREKNLGSEEWLLALQKGYKIANDKEGRGWAEDEILRLFPKSSAARRMVRQRWDEEHPRPKPDESALRRRLRRYQFHRKNQVLPEFALADLQGKKWQLADLKGKVAFINFWATWCGPCKQELPYVQKLHEQMKENKDVVVLTFNTDDELGLVEPFMKENKYNFTVVLAQEYAEGQNVDSIPRNWIITGDGVLQFEGIGFSGDGDEWMKKAMEMIQKVKGGK